MIIDTTQPVPIPKQPYIGLVRTVIYILGVLTSLNVHIWEKRTGLKFEWNRAINGENEFDVMAEQEFNAIHGVLAAGESNDVQN